MVDVRGSDVRSDSFDRGLGLLRQLGGLERPAVLDLFESIGESEFGEDCVAFIYGDVYHRPGLSLPQRQLATVGALTALGYAPSQLQFHAKAALHAGCTQQQVVETIIQLSSFAGFPATLNALGAVKEAFAGIPRDGAENGETEKQPWADIEDRYERGVAAMEAVDGEAGKRVAEALEDIAPDLARYILEFTFGEIYPRPHLSLKDREIVTVAGCTALGTALPQLKVHIHGLLNVGGTRAELIETLLHLAFYAGFPATLNALGAAKDVLAERAER